MSNLTAAIGLAQLSRLPEMAATRRALAARYDERLAEHERIRPLARHVNGGVPHIYVVRLPGLTTRRELQQRLLAQGIQTGVHYQPNHWLTFFRDASASPLPVVDAIYPELLTLPMHADLRLTDVDRVCDVLLADVAAHS